jgi:hypothetical protein
MTTMPFIPEFSGYRERNLWIVNNAQLFTAIRRQNRSYERTEFSSYDDAIKFATKQVSKDENKRYLIYAIAGRHDALAATVSTKGVVRHE